MLKKIGVIFSFILLALSGFQLAEAKRFGGGASQGYSRSAPTQNYNSAAGKQAQKRGGMGMFGTILAALGLGALFAWLFSSQGMTGVLIVVALIALLVFFMRRKAIQQTQSQHGASNAHNSPSPLRSATNAFTNHNQTSTEHSFTTQSHETQYSVQNGQLPDGTPETVFNHQALNLFNQLQSLNNQAGLEKIKGYITEDLYKSVVSEIENNEELAQFKDVSCKVVDCDRQGTQWIASVMFVGQVKEDSNSTWQNFEEIWHFTRKDGEHLWQVAGIQQF